MVRAALQGRKIGQGPRPTAAYVPAASVVAASLLSALPIISTSGWYPSFGFLVLIGWRLLRPDVWPIWWAAPLGLANDLIAGTPVGLSVVTWTAAMLALELLDRRTMWRDYWVEWGLAAALIIMHETAEWYVAGLTGAALPFSAMVPPLLISTLAFPVAAWAVSRLDSWRLGR